VLICALLLLGAVLFGVISSLLLCVMGTVAVAGSIIGCFAFLGASVTAVVAGCCAAGSITGVRAAHIGLRLPANNIGVCRSACLRRLCADLAHDLQHAKPLHLQCTCSQMLCAHSDT
jgi:hypothetical protein